MTFSPVRGINFVSNWRGKSSNLLEHWEKVFSRNRSFLYVFFLDQILSVFKLKHWEIKYIMAIQSVCMYCMLSSSWGICWTLRRVYTALEHSFLTSPSSFASDQVCTCPSWPHLCCPASFLSNFSSCRRRITFLSILLHEGLSLQAPKSGDCIVCVLPSLSKSKKHGGEL